MKNYKSRIVALNSKSKLIFGIGITSATGAYYLVSQTTIISDTTSFVKTQIEYSIGSISDFVGTSMDRIRSGFFVLERTLSDWSSLAVNSLSFNFDIQKLPVLLENGGRNLIEEVPKTFMSLCNFLFVDLYHFVRDHKVSEIVDYIKHYGRSLKLLFSRPENTERMKSVDARLDQIIKSVKTPGFFESLKSMNSFYIKFKDQIQQLSDEQLSELIDFYLEDPIDMQNKVDLVMKHLGDNPKDIEDNFDVELMMNFIRSENVDDIRAKITASKVTDTLFKIFGGSEYGKKGVSEALGKVFVGVSRLWNMISW